MRAYQIESICEAFRAACDQFESLIETLNGEAARRMEHGQVEALIQERGTEVLRLLLQGHLDVRATREERRADVSGPDGRALPYCRSGCKRSLMTLFGEVTVKRKGYRRSGGSGVFPLDGELNLPGDKFSHGLRRRVAEEAADTSFEEAIERIGKTSGGRIAKRQAEELTVRAARDFAAFYAASHEPGPGSDLLILSVDGKGVVMRREDLRPATRRASEQAGKNRDARLGPGEKRNRKRMATVAAVYDLEAHARTPEQVMGGRDSVRPRAANKRVWASVEREPAEVIGDAFREALRRDPDRSRPWVVVVDGAESQLERLFREAKRCRVSMTLVLDFIHVLEYLWRAAHALHPVGSKQAEDWVAQRALRVLKGEAAGVARALRAESAPLSAMAKCADYLEKYLPLLDYGEFLAHGFPIASGVIEGACRHLIKDRLDRTGARWRLKGAEAVLKIRSLRSSGDFEAYWAFHQAREWERNHSRCRQVPNGSVASREEIPSLQEFREAA